MKVRIEMEVDLQSGAYDVRLHNLSEPGAEVDVGRLAQVAQRVLENVAENAKPRPVTLHPPRRGNDN